MLRALIAVAAVVVVACASEPSPTASAVPDALAPWGPLAVARSTGNGDMALTEGVLEIGAHCVFVTAGNERTLLAWPDARTRWIPGSSSIVFLHRDGSAARLDHGQRWGFGGSGDAAQAVIARLDWVAPPEPECAARWIWSVGEVIER